MQKYPLEVLIYRSGCMFNKRSFLAIIVSIIIVFTTTFGMLMYLDRRDYRIFLGNQYQKAYMK